MVTVAHCSARVEAVRFRRCVAEAADDELGPTHATISQRTSRSARLTDKTVRPARAGHVCCIEHGKLAGSVPSARFAAGARDERHEASHPRDAGEGIHTPHPSSLWNDPELGVSGANCLTDLRQLPPEPAGGQRTGKTAGDQRRRYPDARGQRPAQQASDRRGSE
jgi:hypothetical protein